jgi:hypothetical protein
MMLARYDNVGCTLRMQCHGVDLTDTTSRLLMERSTEMTSALSMLKGIDSLVEVVLRHFHRSAL